MRLRTLLATACLATAALIGAPATATAAPAPGSVPPSEDPFYAPPAKLPARNGDVIRSRPFTAYVSPVVVNGTALPIPARGWQVMYRSTDTGGTPIAVTGSVLVPYPPWLGDRPLIGYSPGTVGPGDRCAPSYGLARGSWYESALTVDALAAGYAVMVPDFEGVGTPAASTYITGRSEGHAVLDGLRAAQRLSGAGLSSYAPTALWGYSQGGHATAWAGQLQPSYAPALNLKAIAPGGLPGDLELIMEGAEQASLSLTAWVYQGWHHAYPNLPWDSLLTPLGKQKTVEGSTKCVMDPDAGLIGTDNGDTVYAGLTAGDIFAVNPRTRSQWRSTAAANSPGAIAPGAPVYIYGSTEDELVPYEAQRSTFRKWCDLGVDVQWQDTAPLPHAGAAIQGNPGALAWISGRFAGRPAQSDC